MGINWNDDSHNIASLLTSSDPIERIKGHVLYTLRHDLHNMKTGDQLFIEAANKLIAERIQQNLALFIGTNITPQILTRVAAEAQDFLTNFVSSPPVVRINTPTSTNIELTIICQ